MSTHARQDGNGDCDDVPCDCPDRPTVEEPRHRAARQPTDEERLAARSAALDSMKAGLPKLAEKARALSERRGGSGAR